MQKIWLNVSNVIMRCPWLVEQHLVSWTTSGKNMEFRADFSVSLIRKRVRAIIYSIKSIRRFILTSNRGSIKIGFHILSVRTWYPLRPFSRASSLSIIYHSTPHRNIRSWRLSIPLTAWKLKNWGMSSLKGSRLESGLVLSWNGGPWRTIRDISASLYMASILFLAT